MKKLIQILFYCILFACIATNEENPELNQWYTNQVVGSGSSHYYVPLPDEEKNNNTLLQVASYIISSTNTTSYYCVQIRNLVPGVKQKWDCSNGTYSGSCMGYLNAPSFSLATNVSVIVCCSDSILGDSASCPTSCSSSFYFDIYFSYIQGSNPTTDCANEIPEIPYSVSPTPSPSASSSGSPDGTSAWIWVFISLGIIIGVIVVIALIGAGAFFIYKKRTMYNSV